MEKETFKLEAVLVPEQVEMVDYPSKPLGIWNPAAYIKNDKLVIIPRLHFDTKFYASSVGLCEPISFDVLDRYNMGKRSIKTSILKYPTTNLEVDGIEDPRVTEDGERILTVGINRGQHKSQTTMSDFDGKKVSNPKPLLYNGSELDTGRDAVLLNDHILFFRPETALLDTYEAYYEVTADNVVLTKCFNEPVLPRLRGTIKTAFSTNAVKLSNSESLIAYHGVFAEKHEYKEGFMLVDNEGNTLGRTPLFLKTEGILRYGSGRSFTLFGCGLVLRKGVLFFVGGVGDTWTAIFSANVGDVLDKIGGKQMDKRRLGNLDDVMDRIWTYYVSRGASNRSTRRHLTNMKAFTETQIFRLMEKLQIAKSDRE